MSIGCTRIPVSVTVGYYIAARDLPQCTSHDLPVDEDTLTLSTTTARNLETDIPICDGVRDAL
jgi:hypothetical protein